MQQQPSTERYNGTAARLTGRLSSRWLADYYSS
jgi:hypothetical protein